MSEEFNPLLSSNVSFHFTDLEAFQGSFAAAPQINYAAQEIHFTLLEDREGRILKKLLSNRQSWINFQTNGFPPDTWDHIDVRVEQDGEHVRTSRFQHVYVKKLKGEYPQVSAWLHQFGIMFGEEKSQLSVTFGYSELDWLI